MLLFGTESFVFQFAIQKVKDKIYRTIILPVVLYGCETWSLTLREERRLRVFENRVLRRVFGSKRDEVTGKWRKLHNEELSFAFLCFSVHKTGSYCSYMSLIQIAEVASTLLFCSQGG